MQSVTISEIKRKVIGQVLEYGAAMWGMSYEDFDQKVQERTRKPLAELVQNEIDDPAWDEELFRSNIEDNLQEGNLILVVVVDEINDQLTRIIRFLNACGDPKFSFAALELRRFQSGDIEILLPKVGGDYRPSSMRGSSKRKSWNKESLFEDAREKCGQEVYQMLADLYDFSIASAPGGVDFGSGKSKGSYTYYFSRDNTRASIFSVYSNGDISINLGAMVKIFKPEEIDEFTTRLANISALHGIEESDKYWNTYKLGVDFSDPEEIETFKKCVLSLNDMS